MVGVLLGKCPAGGADADFSGVCGHCGSMEEGTPSCNDDTVARMGHSVRSRNSLGSIPWSENPDPGHPDFLRLIFSGDAKGLGCCVDGVRCGECAERASFV